MAEVAPKIRTIVVDIFGTFRNFSRGFIPGHDGWDLPAPVGTPVYAVKAGIVSYAKDARIAPDKGASGWAMGGGKVVNIDIGSQLHTQYAHLSNFVVKEGQTVAKGQLIGYVGKTGGRNSDGSFGGAGAEFVGSHLHFGVWNKKINQMVRPETVLGGIGDTSNAFLDRLKALGIPTSLDHIITQSEAQKMVEAWYPAQERMWPTLVSRFAGKTVGEVKTATDTGEAISNDPIADAGKLIPDIPGAIGEVGNTITKVVTYVLAVVIIMVGLWLYSKSNAPKVEVPA